MFARLFAALRSVRLAPLALAGCMAFAGCADLSTMTPTQQAIEQSKRRFATTTAEGAVAGALLGALIGGLAGGGRGALIGAGAGAVAGGVAGSVVAQNNYQKSRSEGDLQTAIADATTQANNAERDARTAQQIAAEARASSQRLMAQYRSGQITAAQVRSNLASYNTSIATLKEISNGAAEQAAEMRKSAAMAGGNGQVLNSSAQRLDAASAGIDRAAAQLRATLSAEPE